MKTDNLKVLLVVLGILVLGLAGTTFMFYKKSQALAVNPQKVAQEENQKLIDAIGKLVLLPAGETPTIDTVTDSAKLKSQQAFFARSTDGDKVLIYTHALKAIMYRPSTNQIVEIAPLVIGSPNTPAATTPNTTPAPVK